MVGRRKVPLSLSAALASLQSLDPWNTKQVQRDLCCMALVLASRSEYFGKAEQFHFILAIKRSFPRSRLEFGSSGRDSDLLAAARVACRETKLEGCADSIKTIAHRSNTCERHGPSISCLTTQLRFHYALNIDSDPFSQKVSVLLDTLRAWRTPQQHYGMAALVLNVVISTHGHGHVSTHVRWLYLIRVANAAVCKFMQVLSCFACGKTFSRAREEDTTRSSMCPASAASC